MQHRIMVVQEQHSTSPFSCKQPYNQVTDEKCLKIGDINIQELTLKEWRMNYVPTASWSWM